jgi:hypothetical protein
MDLGEIQPENELEFKGTEGLIQNQLSGIPLLNISEFLIE